MIAGVLILLKLPQYCRSIFGLYDAYRPEWINGPAAQFFCRFPCPDLTSWTPACVVEWSSIIPWEASNIHSTSWDGQCLDAFCQYPKTVNPPERACLNTAINSGWKLPMPATPLNHFLLSRLTASICDSFKNKYGTRVFEDVDPHPCTCLLVFYLLHMR